MPTILHAARTGSELNATDPQQELHSQKFPHLRRMIFLGAQSQAGMIGWSELLAWAKPSHRPN